MLHEKNCFLKCNLNVYIDKRILIIFQKKNTFIFTYLNAINNTKQNMNFKSLLFIFIYNKNWNSNMWKTLNVFKHISTRIKNISLIDCYSHVRNKIRILINLVIYQTGSERAMWFIHCNCKLIREEILISEASLYKCIL